LIHAWCDFADDIDDADSKEIFNDLMNWIAHTPVEIDYDALMVWRRNIYALMHNVDECNSEEDDVLDFVWGEECCSLMTKNNFRTIFDDAPMPVQHGFITLLEQENDEVGVQELDLNIHYAGETYGNYDDDYVPPESQPFQFPDGTESNPIVIDDSMPELESDDDSMPELESDDDSMSELGHAEVVNLENAETDCETDYDTDDTDCETDYDTDDTDCETDCELDEDQTFSFPCAVLI